MPRARNAENKGLPTRWKLYHGAYYYQVPAQRQKTLGRVQIRLGKTREEADQEYANVVECITVGTPHRPGERRRTTITTALVHRAGFDKAECGLTAQFLVALYTSARGGAASRNIEWRLSIPDLVALARQSAGRCVLTGIPWSFSWGRTGVTRPWIPSIDRIDSGKGYALANCRLVCWAVNRALADHGEDVLRRIAEGLIAHVEFNRKTPPCGGVLSA